MDAAPGLAEDTRAASRGGLTLTLFQTVARVLGLAFITITTHAVGRGDFGRYSIVSSLVVLATFLADFGITPAVTRAVARDPEGSERIVGSAVVPSAVLGLVAYGGIVAFAAVSNYPAPVLVDVAIGGLAVPATSVLTTLQASLDGAGLIARRALVSFLAVAGSTLGGLVGVTVTGDIRQAMVWMAVGPAVAVAAAHLLVRRHRVWSGRIHRDVATVVRLAKTVVPFALLSGLGAIYGRLDVILLSLFGSSGRTATYDLALRVVEAGGFLATAVTAPALYLLTARIGNGDHAGAQRAFAELTRVVTTLGLALSAVLVGSGHALVALAFGASYGRSGTLLVLMGTQVWLHFIALAQGALITAGDHVRQGLVVAAAITGAYAVATVGAVVAFGDIGAVATLIAVQVVTVIAFGLFHRRTSGIRTPWPDPRAVLAAVAAIGAARLTAGVGDLVSIAVGPVVFAAVALATGAVHRHDLARLVSVVKPRPAPARDGTPPR